SNNAAARRLRRIDLQRIDLPLFFGDAPTIAEKDRAGLWPARDSLFYFIAKDVTQVPLLLVDRRCKRGVREQRAELGIGGKRAEVGVAGQGAEVGVVDEGGKIGTRGQRAIIGVARQRAEVCVA